MSMQIELHLKNNNYTDENCSSDHPIIFPKEFFLFVGHKKLTQNILLVMDIFNRYMPNDNSFKVYECNIQWKQENEFYFYFNYSGEEFTFDKFTSDIIGCISQNDLMDYNDKDKIRQEHFYIAIKNMDEET